MKISIIIPVYNAQEFLEDALQSVYQQDLPETDFEVLVIDDGSRDGSAEIVKKIAASHSNIVFVQQPNSGVSVARNNGLNRAQGKYLLFLDADDFLNPGCLKPALAYTEKEDLDLLYLKISFTDAKGTVTDTFQMDSDVVQIQDGFTHQRRGFIFGIYKKETLGDIRFIKDIPVGEDALFNIMMHTVSQRVSYFPHDAYMYRRNDNSVTGNASPIRYSEKAFLGTLKSIETLYGFIHNPENKIPASKMAYFNRPFYKFSQTAIQFGVTSVAHFDRVKRLHDLLWQCDQAETIAVLKKEFPYFSASKLYFSVLFLTCKLLRRC